MSVSNQTYEAMIARAEEAEAKVERLTEALKSNNPRVGVSLFLYDEAKAEIARLTKLLKEREEQP